MEIWRSQIGLALGVATAPFLLSKWGGSQLSHAPTLEDEMSSHVNHTKQHLAVAGILGMGAVLGGRVVLPLVQRWATPHTDACPLLAVCGDEELDRWANEGGCCARAADSREDL